MSGGNQGNEKRGSVLGLAAALWLGAFFVALLSLPAYMLAVAIHEAVTTGTVRVSPVNRGAPRAWVAWPHAWAHLLGLALIVVGGLPILLSPLIPRLRGPRGGFLVLALVLVTLIALPLGFAFWLFPGSLTSFRGAQVLVVTFASIAAMLWIGKRFGRAVAYFVLFAWIGFALYYFTSR